MFWYQNTYTWATKFILHDLNIGLCWNEGPMYLLIKFMHTVSVPDIYIIIFTMRSLLDANQQNN